MPFLITPLGSFFSCDWVFIWKGVKKQKHSNPPKTCISTIGHTLKRERPPEHYSVQSLTSLRNKPPWVPEVKSAVHLHTLTPFLPSHIAKDLQAEFVSLLSSVLLRDICAHMKHSVNYLLNCVKFLLFKLGKFLMQKNKEKSFEETHHPRARICSK